MGKVSKLFVEEEKLDVAIIDKLIEENAEFREKFSELKTKIAKFEEISKDIEILMNDCEKIFDAFLTEMNNGRQ